MPMIHITPSLLRWKYNLLPSESGILTVLEQQSTPGLYQNHRSPGLSVAIHTFKGFARQHDL